MTFTPHSNPILAAAGYKFEDGMIKAPNASEYVDPEVVPRMEGRLNNVEYMARAIDIFDNMPDGNLPVGTETGSAQFHHLLNTPAFLAVALGYIAMRRSQRRENLGVLRVMLSLMLSLEDGQIGEGDIVGMLTTDLQQLYALDRNPKAAA